MWNQVETYTKSNISATPANFTLRGGRYGVDVMGTNFGTVKLKKLLGDGTTFVSVGSTTDFAANGYAAVDLPSGTYQIEITTATAVYVNIAAIVTSQ